MAEKRTTTPALITHVMTVGLTAALESEMLALRLFFARLRSLGDADRRLAFEDAELGGVTKGALWRDGSTGGLVFNCLGESGCSSPLSSSSPMATDSPTSRKEGVCVVMGGPARGLD